MKKIYQVFVSSTYQDLKEERNEVIKTLLRLDCIPVGMETFPASNETQLDLIKRRIDEADYYVVIIAGKYGSEYNGKSYTQLEYEYAVKKKKKIIALLHRNLSALPAYKCEEDPTKKEKLNKFRELVKKKMCAFWEDKGELSTALFQAMNELKQYHKADGWIKASKYNLRKLSEKRNNNLIKQNKRLKKEICKLKEQITKLEEDRYKSVSPTSPIAAKEIIKSKIIEIDNKINALFPEKIHSPRHSTVVPFSSKMILNSLSSMGVPIEVCFDVLDMIFPELIGLKRKVSQLSTSHIREAVSNALYKLDQDKYSEAQIQAWADAYIRRYGNPTSRIVVLMDTNNELEPEIVPLTYRFIKKNILKKLITDILGKSRFNHFISSVREKEDSRMAKAILDAVKNLDVSRIHYNTLLALSNDLALQPPHPWLVPNAFSYQSISYEFERASFHVINVKSFMAGHNDKGVYPIRECIHHSCSGILATYGAFMGCGYLSPLYNLSYYLNKIVDGKSADVFSYSQLQKIVDDCMLVFSDIKKFKKFINSLKEKVKLLDRDREPNIQDICKDTIKLFKVFRTIATKYYPELDSILE